MVGESLEVACGHRGCGHGCRGIRIAGTAAIPLVIDHKEELFSAVVNLGYPDRTIRLKSEIVVLERVDDLYRPHRMARREPIRLRVYIVVPDELVHAAVEAIGAALADHVDL